MRKMHRIIHMVLVIALVLGGILPLVTPAYAVSQPADNKATGGDGAAPLNPSGEIPQLTPAQRQKMAQDAQAIASALVLKDDGTAEVNPKAAAHLNQEQRQLLERLVSDINTGEIGLAITHEDGSVDLYGSELALSAEAGAQLNGAWVDGRGLHVYLSGRWLAWAIEYWSYANTLVRALIWVAGCGTIIGCAQSFIIDYFIREVVEGILTAYVQYALAGAGLYFFMPRWNFPREAQMWLRYNGRWCCYNRIRV